PALSVWVLCRLPFTGDASPTLPTLLSALLLTPAGADVDRPARLSHETRQRFRAPGSVWFQDLDDRCLTRSFTPQRKGVGDGVGSTGHRCDEPRRRQGHPLGHQIWPLVVRRCADSGMPTKPIGMPSVVADADSAGVPDRMLRSLRIATWNSV